MNVVVALCGLLEPGKLLRVTSRLFSAIFAVLDIWGHPQNSWPVGAIQTCFRNPRAYVHAHAVVQIRVPTKGLLLESLPAYEHVVRFLPFENLLQLALQMLGSGKPAVGTFQA